MKVNIHEAKTNLSRLLERVEAGEEVVICRAGKPVAKLERVIAPEKKLARREPGGWEGKVWMSDDFDDPLPEEILAAFRGERP
jgi:antitoxin (DNA-binding transcriptional repressor) of toxin-antitoxin stability system